MVNISIRKINYYQNTNEFVEATGKIESVINYDDYQKVYIKINSRKFYFNNVEERLSAGDIVYVKGFLKNRSKEHTPNGLNYRDYLEYQGIVGKINVETINKVGTYFTVNSLHEKLCQYVDDNFDDSYKNILKALVIGDKSTFDEELSNQIQKIGIGHLFVISGLHMSIVVLIIENILKRIKILRKIKFPLTLGCLIMYYIISSFMVSILRVVISYVLSNNKKMKYFTSIDKLSLNACLVLLFNPYYLFSFSFLLSYIIVFGILLIQHRLMKQKGIKSSIVNNLIISTNSFLISLPIIVQINSKVNLMSIIFNIFFIPFVSYIILPLSFLTFLIPPIGHVYKYLISLFLYLTNLCSQFELFTISFSQTSIFFCSLYYIVFILLMKETSFKKFKTLSICFIILMIYWLLQPYLNLKSEVHFLDLPKGESTLISKHNNLTNILIDTGDVDAAELVSFLKRRGVKRLDAVIISHGDSDHIGGLYTLVKEFDIKKIIISKYDFASEKILKNQLFSNIHILKVKKGDNFIIGGYNFKVLWPSHEEDDVNNASIVLMAYIDNLKILFTGDIEKEAEEQFCKLYSSLQFDILKVAHHASNTSSSTLFLSVCKFKIAVAMNGYNNTFGFPSPKVISRFSKLKNVKLFNTLDNGTITFARYIWSNSYQLYTTFN